jgi:hypothetical protein
MTMQVFHTFLSEYKHEDRRCEVWLDENKVFCTRHYKQESGFEVWQKDVKHYGHNEMWAEDAAENWVFKVNS